MNRQQRRAAQRGRHLTERPRPEALAVDPVASLRRLYARGKYEEAERGSRRLLVRDAGDHGARVVLASSLREQGRFDEATMEARRAVTGLPDNPVAHETLGRCLLAQDRVVESVAAFERAVGLAPERPEAMQGLGAALLDGGLVTRASEQFTRVIDRLPQDPAGYVSLSAAQLILGDFAAVVATTTLAAERGLAEPMLAWNGSLASLGLGDLETGWAGYERGLEVGARTPNRTFDVPRWRGQDVSGASILVWREQGLGDEVRFASCLEELSRCAGHVTAEVSPRLVSMFARSVPTVTFRADRSDQGTHQRIRGEGFDLHAPLGALPATFRSSTTQFPRRAGFLTADPEQRVRFRERLAALPTGMKVGICWRSMNLRTSRLRAYATLDELAPVLDVDGVTFVNLQYGPADLLAAELEDLRARTGRVVHTWTDLDYTNDLEACAALTAELDMVVGPSSFPTILAGALGVPTLHFRTPFAWTHGEPDDPWFRNTEHFVRAWDEPWDAPIAAMRDVLAARTAAFAPHPS